MAHKEPHFDYWQGESTRWYWHFKARNGQVIADGAEGFATKSNAMRAARNFVKKIKALP